MWKDASKFDEKFNILNGSPLEIARQLTMLEYGLFLQIDPVQLLERGYRSSLPPSLPSFLPSCLSFKPKD